MACGAEAISLIPRNDNVATSRAESRQVTETALRALLPMLQSYGLKAMVEPLGFEVCSLRYKDVLADVIEAVGGKGTYFMVHDTFHHALAGGGPIYPELTGIVHVSGVKDSIYVNDMRDPHRVLVDADDLLGNVAQIRALRSAGYTGADQLRTFCAAACTIWPTPNRRWRPRWNSSAQADCCLNRGQNTALGKRAVRPINGVPDTNLWRRDT